MGCGASKTEEAGNSNSENINQLCAKCGTSFKCPEGSISPICSKCTSDQAVKIDVDTKPSDGGGSNGSGGNGGGKVSINEVQSIVVAAPAELDSPEKKPSVTPYVVTKTIDSENVSEEQFPNAPTIIPSDEPERPTRTNSMPIAAPVVVTWKRPDRSLSPSRPSNNNQSNQESNVSSKPSVQEKPELYPQLSGLKQ